MIENGVVSVQIPPKLRSFTFGYDEVTASGDTIAEILESLTHIHPDIGAHLVQADGGLSPAFEVYLGGANVRELQGLATPVGLEELVSIIPVAPG